MTTIVTRAGKGAPLTHAELDANFTNLNTDKVEAAAVTSTATTISNSGISTHNSDPAAHGGVVTTAELDAAVAAAVATALANDTPTGFVGYTAAPSPPTGWLARDGAAVSRTTYAALFAVIGTTWGAGDGSTTFNVPDGRGEFDRGWDNGRGIDSGRALGVHQLDAFKSHTHSIGPVSEGSGGSAGFQGANWGAGVTGATGGTETRPRNYAYLAIIKA